MGPMASQMTSLTIVYTAIYSGADQRKHQSSVSLAFLRGIHRGPVNSPHKWPITEKMFPFDDVIMQPFHLSTLEKWLLFSIISQIQVGLVHVVEIPPCGKQTHIFLHSRYHRNWLLVDVRNPGCWAIRYLSESHLKLKSREISFVHNLLINYPIALIFCAEHGSDTAMLCVKFRNDCRNVAYVMDGWDYVRFGFKMSFGRISYIAQHPRVPAAMKWSTSPRKSQCP